MSNISRVAIDRLEQVVVADFEQGKLYWRSRNLPWWDTRYAGKECFLTLKAGYLYGTVDKIRLSKHRVLYALHHKQWPDQIDHIDRDKSNNSVYNLRSVDKKTNSRNYGITSTNKSGVVGVCFKEREKLWYASIHDLKPVALGYFKNKEDAIMARKQAEVRLGYNRN